MESFDIKSLYTNVPLHETKSLILNLAFTHNTNIYEKFNKTPLKKLLEICLLDTYFILNKKIGYGSTRSSHLSEYILCINEKKA